MEQQIPKGLVFSTKSPSRKKRALVLTDILFVLQVCMLWPVYPLLASSTPQILGFPLSFAWVIFILLLAFVAILAFYLKDKEEAS